MGALADLYLRNALGRTLHFYIACGIYGGAPYLASFPFNRNNRRYLMQQSRNWRQEILKFLQDNAQHGSQL